MGVADKAGHQTCYQSLTLILSVIEFAIKDPVL